MFEKAERVITGGLPGRLRFNRGGIGFALFCVALFSGQIFL